MKKKLFLVAMLGMVLAFGLVVTGCASAPKELPAVPGFNPLAFGPNLMESLGKYMGPNPQTWDGEEVDVYYLDHLRFNEFKAELEALGEYEQNDSGNYTRDWDQAKTFARWAVRSDGRLELTFANADNSTFEYRYTKKPQTSELKLAELLRKYIGPQQQTWGDGADAEEVYVYFLDPSRFDQFKTELDAGGEYYPFSSWNRNRDIEKTVASLYFRVGRLFLELRKAADNSIIGYQYKEGTLKVPQVGDTWDEQWDEGRVTYTYLGLNCPEFVLDQEGRGGFRYEGYYTTYNNDRAGPEGHRKRYIYYPITGMDAQYSAWFD